MKAFRIDMWQGGRKILLREILGPFFIFPEAGLLRTDIEWKLLKLKCGTSLKASP
jgi:hypothetical protein